MSELAVTTIKHESSPSSNIILDSTGNSTFNGAVKTSSLMNPSGSGSAIALDAAGRVTMPYQPTFSGIVATNELGQTGWVSSFVKALYLPNGVASNRGNHMNLSTGIFTCPVAGSYLCFGSILMGNNGYGFINFSKNGVPAPGHLSHVNNLGTGYVTTGGSIVIDCEVNDQLYFGASAPGSGTPYFTSSYGLVSITFLG